MKYFLPLLFLQIISITSAIAQKSDSHFKWTPFKYSIDELPYSIGVGPASGIGSQGPGIGVLLDCDLYHILISGRFMLYGFPPTDYIGGMEKSILFGYQFRLSNYILNLGYGFGTLEYHCKSGVGYGCENFSTEKLNSSAIKGGFDYIFSPYSSVGISYNFTRTERSTMNAFTIGMKVGYFKRKETNSIK